MGMSGQNCDQLGLLGLFPNVHLSCHNLFDPIAVTQVIIFSPQLRTFVHLIAGRPADYWLRCGGKERLSSSTVPTLGALVLLNLLVVFATWLLLLIGFFRCLM